jgi:transcriptional regulator with XRE-family HTH domain
METLGEFLKKMRKNKDATLRNIEKNTGISNSYLSQLENDKIKKPSPLVLYKLSSFYKISYTDLMTRSGYPVDSKSNLQHISTPSQIKKRKSDKPKNNDLREDIFDTLTPDEENELIDYLNYLRSKKRE